MSSKPTGYGMGSSSRERHETTTTSRPRGTSVIRLTAPAINTAKPKAKCNAGTTVTGSSSAKSKPPTATVDCPTDKHCSTTTAGRGSTVQLHHYRVRRRVGQSPWSIRSSQSCPERLTSARAVPSAWSAMRLKDFSYAIQPMNKARQGRDALSHAAREHADPVGDSAEVVGRRVPHHRRGFEQCHQAGEVLYP